MKLADRFETLGKTRAPDLWPDIERREPGPPTPGVVRGNRALTAAVALAVATAAIGLTVRAFFGGEAPRPAGTAQGHIVFVVQEGGPASGRTSIVRMAPDGSGRTGLTSGAPPSFDGSPAWSPDGERIAFSRDFGIHVMDADGNNVSPLGAEGSGPTWSADRTRLAFQCSEAICVVNLDSGEVSQLTDPLLAHNSGPAWSPDGKLIAFTRTSVEPGTGDFTQLYIMNPDGTGATRLLDVLGYTEPAWSPDGRRIAFFGRADQRQRSWEIFVVNADSTGLTRLTHDDAIDGDPAWSPDGTRIVFSRRVGDGDSDIYVMNADGSGMTRLTSDPADESAPAWQPVPATEAPRTPTEAPAPGSIAMVSGDELPEGKLLVQVNDQVELLEEGADTSMLIGQDQLALDLSRDGSRALVSTPWESFGPEAPLVSLDLSTGERTTIANAEGWSFPARWSPDGSRVAYRVGEKETLCIRDLVADEPRCLTQLGRVYEFDWSPDGTRLVLDQGPPGSLTILDVGTGQTTVVARWDDPVVLDAVRGAGLGPPVGIQFQGPRWSPTGRYLAALAMVDAGQGLSGNVVLVFDLEGRVVAAGQPSGEFSAARGWSPTADVFAYATGEPPYQIVEARLLDVSTGQDRLLVSTANVGRETIRSMAWSPSGRWVAVGIIASRDGTFFSEIRVLDTAGADPPRVFQSFAVAELVDWGP